MAAFYLGAVSNANTSYYNVPAEYPRQYGYAAHFGDEWRVSPKLIANLSIRWDYITPFADKYNNLSFFDPIGGNPGAIGAITGKPLPGRLAYAGTKWGSASYGAPYPEVPFKNGWAPRVGFAYTLNDKTVVRAGYGIYYGQAFYPGWDGGMSQDGFNKTVSLNETTAGSFKVPALYLAKRHFSGANRIDSQHHQLDVRQRREFAQVPPAGWQQAAILADVESDRRTAIACQVLPSGLLCGHKGHAPTLILEPAEHSQSRTTRLFRHSATT